MCATGDSLREKEHEIYDHIDLRDARANATGMRLAIAFNAFQLVRGMQTSSNRATVARRCQNLRSVAV